MESPVAEVAHCSPPNRCSMFQTIEHHARAIDAAHVRLREHDAAIASLVVETDHVRERVSRVEAATSDNHRLLVTLDSRVEGMRNTVDTMASDVLATRELLQGHITTTWGNMDRLTLRVIRLTAMVGGVLAILAAILGVMTGKVPWEILTSSGG